MGASTSAGEPLGNAPNARRPFAFPRARRLTTSAELGAVRESGRKVRTEHLDVRVAPAGAGHRPAQKSDARIGIIVPRHRHSAVDRNRLKRRLRELARTRLLPTLPPCHVVIRARREAYEDSFDALARQIERVAREAPRILNPDAAPNP